MIISKHAGAELVCGWLMGTNNPIGVALNWRLLRNLPNHQIKMTAKYSGYTVYTTNDSATGQYNILLVLGSQLVRSV